MPAGVEGGSLRCRLGTDKSIDRSRRDPTPGYQPRREGCSMPTQASQDAVPSEDIVAGGPLTRRRSLTYVVAAPVLTVAASSAGALIAPGKAYAVVPSPPQPESILDLGDVMVAATKQAQEPAP